MSFDAFASTHAPMPYRQISLDELVSKMSQILLPANTTRVDAAFMDAHASGYHANPPPTMHDKRTWTKRTELRRVCHEIAPDARSLFTKVANYLVPTTGTEHGGFGQRPGVWVPEPQVPIEDVGRKQLTTFIRAGGTIGTMPEDLVLLRGTVLLRAGHVGRHLMSFTGLRAQLMRITRKEDPYTKSEIDWSRGDKHVTENRTAGFLSTAAMVLAEGGIWGSAEAAMARHDAERKGWYSFSVRKPARELLGTNFRRYLYGMRRILDSDGSTPAGVSLKDLAMTH